MTVPMHFGSVTLPGCSVRISRRDDVVPKATWTWMEALEDCRNLIFGKPFIKVAENTLEQSRRQANGKQNRWGCMFSKPFTTVFNELELEHREEMSRNLARLLQGDDNFYLPLNLSTYQSTSPRQ